MQAIDIAEAMILWVTAASMETSSQQDITAAAYIDIIFHRMGRIVLPFNKLRRNLNDHISNGHCIPSSLDDLPWL